ncbi:Uncharacterised protein [Mycobacteroides abscessus subsp. abscessus]|nr:Uncharacterised protein [Mycobacteroides abscessus subsp. abscessus]
MSPIQGACSPWRTRCRDQLTVTRVRPAAMRRAKVRSSAASRPLMGAAHSGLLGTPSSTPSR